MWSLKKEKNIKIKLKYTKNQRSCSSFHLFIIYVMIFNCIKMFNVYTHTYEKNPYFFTGKICLQKKGS